MIYQAEDRAIYDALVSSFQKDGERETSTGDLMLSVSRYFLGFPYAGNTLEREGREILVINLREFDCFTFVENVVVLTGLVKRGKSTFRSYTTELKRIRYRHGKSDGYSSRLHYFSDWLCDNEGKGIVKDVTRRAGGEPFRKYFHFMTRHREIYPTLRGKKSYQDMAAVEKRLSRRLRYYIPKDAIEKSEEAIENGDIIAITTGIDGLDVIHVGLACHIGKKIHLLHASEVEKKVVISDVPLHEYLSRRMAMTGIMIARISPACQSDGNRTSA